MSTYSFDTIGDLIRKQREKSRYSQRELANLLGISQNQLFKIENDKIEPKFKLMIKLSQILEVCLSDFIPTNSR
jgi:DNA-binding XRE family transcriptional regulator